MSRRSLITIGLCMLVAAAVIAAAHALDPWAHQWLRYERLPTKNNAELDWQRLLRVLGSMYLWLCVGIAFVIVDWNRPPRPRMRDAWSRGALVIFSSALGGLLAELLKLIIGRLRPPMFGEPFGYAFRGAEQWSSMGLGMPSSHAATAAGALFALAMIERRLATPAAIIAVFAALSRVGSGAHYLSDAVAGLVVGVLAGALIWRAHLSMLRRPIDSVSTD